jgi:hypothetical protein
MSHTEYSAQFVQYSSVFLGLEEAPLARQFPFAQRYCCIQQPQSLFRLNPVARLLGFIAFDYPTATILLPQSRLKGQGFRPNFLVKLCVKEELTGKEWQMFVYLSGTLCYICSRKT